MPGRDFVRVSQASRPVLCSALMTEDKPGAAEAQIQDVKRRRSKNQTPAEQTEHEVHTFHDENAAIREQQRSSGISRKKASKTPAHIVFHCSIHHSPKRQEMRQRLQKDVSDQSSSMTIFLVILSTTLL